MIIKSTSNLGADPLTNTATRHFTMLASITMQSTKEIHCSISEINENTLKFRYSIPCQSLDYLFWNQIAGPDDAECLPLSLCKKQKNYSIVSKKRWKKQDFLTFHPLLIPGLFFFETGHLDQMLHSVVSIIMQKMKKSYSSHSEKM